MDGFTACGYCPVSLGECYTCCGFHTDADHCGFQGEGEVFEVPKTRDALDGAPYLYGVFQGALAELGLF